MCAALAIAGAVDAQAQNGPVRTPNDTLVSPSVAADGKVTISIYAPQAGEVGVIGDWRVDRTPIALQKDDLGVWSVEIDGLPADFYSYTLIVDGVRTLDPKNPMIKQGNTGVDNMFLLPGDEIAFADNQPVPHGQIRQVWHQSATLGMQRRMHVYAPPGYDGGDAAYPVLYLLHGGGDEDSGWSTIGRAGFILDNLLERARQIDRDVRLLSIVAGEDDFARPGSEALAAVLDEHGIDHELELTGGGTPGSTGGPTCATSRRNCSADPAIERRTAAGAAPPAPQSYTRPPSLTSILRATMTPLPSTSPLT